MEAVTPAGKVWQNWYGLTHPSDYEPPIARFMLLAIHSQLFEHMDFEEFQNDVLSDCDRVFGGTVN